MNPTSLEAWLNLLENRHQQEIQLGLTRVKSVAERLSLCQPNAVVITVAGTNGKGSTVAALEAIYHAAGFRVGSYTSPHLLAFNERIRVNHQPISDESLCEAFALLERARGDIHLTYFEMTTLAALYYFKQCSLDVVILEVGMGGRLDATNIIDADLAIITTVDLDHQEHLGDTIEAIGFEKAGILRANQLFIYADTQPPASIVEQAAALNTQMKCLGVDYSFKIIQANVAHDVLQIADQSGDLIGCVDNSSSEGLRPATCSRDPEILLNTQHDCTETDRSGSREQVAGRRDLNCQHALELPRPSINLKAAASAVIASGLLLDKLPVNSSQLRLSMQEVALPGRQQVEVGLVTTVFDVAHNPQAVSLLADFINERPRTGKVHAVFSALKDKDLCGLIRPMRSYVDFWYLAGLTGKRAASESILQAAFLEEIGSAVPYFSDPVIAWRRAIERAMPGDLIVIYGSFLLVSAVMAANQEGLEEY